MPSPFRVRPTLPFDFGVPPVLAVVAAEPDDPLAIVAMVTVAIELMVMVAVVAVVAVGAARLSVRVAR
jgi:hypothetical protein